MPTNREQNTVCKKKEEKKRKKTPKKQYLVKNVLKNATCGEVVVRDPVLELMVRQFFL